MSPLIFTANQALLAARAGASYVSPFLGRLDDISTNGTELIYDIVQILITILRFPLKLSVHPRDILSPHHRCAKAGGDITTVPFKVLMQMV